MDGGIRESRPGDEARLREIMLDVLAADAPPAMTAADVSRAIDRVPADRAGTLVSLEGGTIAGYITPRMDDLSVDPAYRRRGHGRRLVAAALPLVRSRGLDRLLLWVPHDGPGRRFAEALGFRYESSLWLFRLPVATTVPSPAFPDDIVVRPIRAGEDEPALRELVDASFAEHPSPISVTLETLRHVHSLPGFDPADVLLASPRGDPGRLVAFCRTDVVAPDERRGDIGMVGVLPEWRGRGLGRELLRWGVDHLRTKGVDVVELAVEARNERALGLYRRTGFEPAAEWPHWALPALPA